MYTLEANMLKACNSLSDIPIRRRPLMVTLMHFRSCTIAVGAVLLSAAPASGELALLLENDRTQYRADPDMFHQIWPEPKLMSGQKITDDDPTDLALHSAEAKLSFPVPVSMLYPFQWEQNFKGSPLCASCRNGWWISYCAATLYLVGLWKGTSIMKGLEPCDLKTPLAFWNLFLAVFSFIGAVRTGPHLFFMLRRFGFEYTLCRTALAGYGNGAVGFWVALFIFSKFFELVDTVFLVVRKRKVGFLHWYHHCSVLLYCWHSYVWEMPTGIYFVVMNYTVHAVMYFYYFLAAVCTKPPKWALMVTIMQLAQMALGIAVTLSHVYILVFKTVPHCDGHIPNLTAALGMYASYFMLFTLFFFNRYCRHLSIGDARKKAADKKL